MMISAAWRSSADMDRIDGIQKIQRIGAQNDSCYQHTDNPRQFQTAADTSRRQTDKKDECERCQHDKFLLDVKKFLYEADNFGRCNICHGFPRAGFRGMQVPAGAITVSGDENDGP